jgi:hypothetical protein
MMDDCSNKEQIRTGRVQMMRTRVMIRSGEFQRAAIDDARVVETRPRRIPSLFGFCVASRSISSYIKSCDFEAPLQFIES